MFDVMVREGFNDKGKQIINVYRWHDTRLSEYLRDVQNNGKFIISVIPLFRHKKELDKETIEAIQEFKKEIIGGVGDEHDDMIGLGQEDD